MDAFAPWANVANLPERAPSRRLRPDALPRPPQVRARLAAAGIDPASAGALFGALLGRGWAAWLVASPNPRRFAAFVLDPGTGAVWAEGRGATPAEALGAVLVVCLDNPPPPAGQDDVPELAGGNG